MIPLLLAAVMALGPVHVEVATLDGHKTTGALAQWTPAHVAVNTDRGRREFATQALLALRPLVPPADVGAAPIRVELGDGSVLQARQYTVHASVAALTMADDARIEVPMAAITAVHLQVPTGAMEQQWEEIRQMDTTADLLVVRKGAVVDYLEGVLLDVTTDTVQFQLDGRTVPVRRSKVDGLVYFRPRPAEPVKPVCRVVTRDGTTINLRQVALAAGRFQLVALADFQWAPPPGIIARFDFSPGKIRFLSDLTPERSRWQPFFDLPAGMRAVLRLTSLRRDAALDGGPLRLAGKTYARGLALRSRSEVTYRLPETFRIFSAVAGIDDAARPDGNVRLVIRGGGRTLFDETIAGTDPPRPLKIGITGLRRLTILVDFGKNIDVGDHLDLCDARVTK